MLVRRTFMRRGHLAVVVVELLGQQVEAADLRHLRELRVAASISACDQLAHARLLDQRAEVREGDAALPRPTCRPSRSRSGSARRRTCGRRATTMHSLMNGLAFIVFSISEGVRFLPPAVIMMSFRRSTIAQLALVLSHHVAGVQPAVGDRRRRSASGSCSSPRTPCRRAPAARRRRRACSSTPSDRRADGARAHAVAGAGRVTMPRRSRSCRRPRPAARRACGRSARSVRRDRRRAGQRDPRAAQADEVLQRPEDRPVARTRSAARSAQAPLARGLSANGAQAAIARSVTAPAGSRPASLHLDVDRRVQLLPDARHAEEHRRARPRAGLPARCGSTRRS